MSKKTLPVLIQGMEISPYELSKYPIPMAMLFLLEKEIGFGGKAGWTDTNIRMIAVMMGRSRKDVLSFWRGLWHDGILTGNPDGAYMFTEKHYGLTHRNMLDYDNKAEF